MIESYSEEVVSFLVKNSVSQRVRRRAESLGFEVIGHEKSKWSPSIRFVHVDYPGDRVVKGDCAYRALSLALNVPYWSLPDLLSKGRKKCPTLADVLDIMYSRSWTGMKLDGPNRRTVGYWTSALKSRALLCTTSHITYCEDGFIFDAWDCSRCYVRYVILPPVE